MDYRVELIGTVILHQGAGSNPTGQKWIKSESYWIGSFRTGLNGRSLFVSLLEKEIGGREEAHIVMNTQTLKGYKQIDSKHIHRCFYFLLSAFIRVP